jgi:hypothetical protein
MFKQNPHGLANPSRSGKTITVRQTHHGKMKENASEKSQLMQRKAT